MGNKPAQPKATKPEVKTEVKPNKPAQPKATTCIAKCTTFHGGAAVYKGETVTVIGDVNLDVFSIVEG